MEDPLLVGCVQCAHELVQDSTRLLLTHRPLRHDLVKELSTRHELHHHVDLLLGGHHLRGEERGGEGVAASSPGYPHDAVALSVERNEGALREGGRGGGAVGGSLCVCDGILCSPP